MLTKVRKTIHEQSENFSKRIENILKVPNRNHRTEEHITELRSSTEGFNIRLDQAEERMSKLKKKTDNRIHPITEEKRKKNGKKNEASLTDFKGNVIYIQSVERIVYRAKCPSKLKER